jgi:hypothetical protein
MSNERPERNDELLSAWLDGELAPAEADELERRLAREPALAERLEAIRSVDEAAVAALRSVDQRPLPALILDLIGEDEEEPRRRHDGAEKVVPLRERPMTRFFQAPVAIAASVAFLAGFLLHAMLGNGGDRAGEVLYAGAIPEGSGLYAAFDRRPSGEAVDLGAGRTAQPVLTFRSVDGNWCRQVRITGAASADTLACRREGAWQIELLSFGEATPAAPESGFQQASSGGTAAMNAAVERLTGREPPLALAAEAELIGAGWQGSGSQDGEAE